MRLFVSLSRRVHVCTCTHVVEWMYVLLICVCMCVCACLCVDISYYHTPQKSLTIGFNGETANHHGRD